jgi:DNA-directed RNA polymerase II subunit RPB2
VTGKKWDTTKNVIWEVKFGQVSVSEHPRHLESDDSMTPLFPHDARIRNLTYSTEIFADIHLSKK